MLKNIFYRRNAPWRVPTGDRLINTIREDMFMNNVRKLNVGFIDRYERKINDIQKDISKFLAK